MDRQVFVAYSYRLHNRDGYRDVFKRVGDRRSVKFTFADERITNEYILHKITTLIEDSWFSIFDISDWNANVTLELGIAIGSGRPWFILIDPSKSTGGIPEAPADLRGLDRLQYSTLDDLEQELDGLILQQENRPAKKLDPPATATRGAEHGGYPVHDTVLFDDLMEVPAGSHSETHGEIRKGSVAEVFARETDGQPFDLTICDRRNYVRSLEGGDGYPIYADGDKSVMSFRKKIPRDGIWYFVIGTSRKQNPRTIKLEIRVRPPAD